MKYWFVCDDIYFLYGLMKVAENRYTETAFINLNDGWQNVLPAAGDVVVLAVNDNYMRSRMLRAPRMLAAKLIMIVGIPLAKRDPGFFPCLISKDITEAEMTALLDAAPHMPVSRKLASLRALNIFIQLGYGNPVKSVTGLPMLTSKSIYRIKRNILQEYGLADCNSVGVLICRDIIAMSHARATSALLRFL